MKITGKRIILGILCLFVLFCGIGIGTFLEHPATRMQRLFVENNIYLYDTHEKIDQWFRVLEKETIEAGIDMNLSEEELNGLRAKIREDVPLAIVGQIGIFYNHNTGGYKIHEVKSGVHRPIATFMIEPSGEEVREFNGKFQFQEEELVPHASVYFRYNSIHSSKCVFRDFNFLSIMI